MPAKHYAATMSIIWIWLILTFLAGALPFGYWIGKAKGVDVKATGSGNIGATNVSRSLGYRWGVAVLLLDALKVAGSVGLVLWLTRSRDLAAATAVVGTLGHVFSPFVGWKGGKGVACLLGAILVLDPVAAGVCLLVFALTIWRTRISSVASISATASLPVILFLHHASKGVIGFGVVAVLLVIWTHRANIGRLRRGEEPRLGRGRS
jgi:glycerol-3-phosphate acyltransferase PlsY